MFWFWMLCFCIDYTQSLKVRSVSTILWKGGGAYWNSENNRLYFVDSMANTVHMYDPAHDQHNYTRVPTSGDHIKFIIPLSGSSNGFLVALRFNLCYMNWSGERHSRVLKPVELLPAGGFQPGTWLINPKFDPYGTLWTGVRRIRSTSSQGDLYEGQLAKITPEQGLQIQEGNLSCSNFFFGIGEDGYTVYCIEGEENAIIAYSLHDFQQGRHEKIRTVLQTDPNYCKFIDGTSDVDKNLWIACYNGLSILNVNAQTGKIIRTIPIKAKQVTSLTWGGPNMNILYATTGRDGLEFEEHDIHCTSGMTFAIKRLGTKGFPSPNFRSERVS